ncbi:hypothetical protein [Cellulosilyticum sp. I15G10I2]|uniref:hypothetical protein n=1 Tax=Cellulosilyticum sp. I15G10I2 TaxID=1892843 RepID=UPI00085BBC88|nr:hypothetical protein [Cellulosilyticum sp. I15G10I2]
MSDVTFGVKVTEEMKNELSELMKINDLSGKEFMGLLLSTYKVEQVKQEDTLFANDMSELQILLQRIQNIYLNINEKSKILVSQNNKIFEEDIEVHKKEKDILKQKIQELNDQIQSLKTEQVQQTLLIKELKENHKQLKTQAEESQTQAKNYLLLHKKFEQEVIKLEAQVEDLKRLEIEIEERNTENTALKNRNDDLASEIWFLKREVEKLQEEKNQLIFTHQLEIKNHLLEQKLELNEKIEKLREENLDLQRDFNTKLQSLYTLTQDHNKKM